MQCFLRKKKKASHWPWNVQSYLSFLPILSQCISALILTIKGEYLTYQMILFSLNTVYIQCFLVLQNRWLGLINTSHLLGTASKTVQEDGWDCLQVSTPSSTDNEEKFSNKGKLLRRFFLTYGPGASMAQGLSLPDMYFT